MTSYICATPHRRQGLRDMIARLRGDCSGLAMVEFAMVLPVLTIMTMSGLELANYALTTKRVSEIAVMVADNASRMGDSGVIKKISEADINDVFIGADLQGSGLDLGTKSRIILSSLQPNAAKNGQTIKWQRCFGTLVHPSSWGNEGDGATDTSMAAGMGPPGNKVIASDGTQVMVVEIRYKYQRIMPLVRLPVSDISETTAFNVRDNRDPGMPTDTDATVTKSACT